MNKIAVFGKPGSGKSTVSKALAVATGIELYQLDSIVYQPNGELVEREVFEKIHGEILQVENWIVDGLGPISSFYKRLEAADTLVYIDLPYLVSYWFVTKRLLKSFFVKPEGWPEGCSVLKGSLESYRILKLCPKFWNAEFLARIQAMPSVKEVYVIKTVAQLNSFVASRLSE